MSPAEGVVGIGVLASIVLSVQTVAKFLLERARIRAGMAPPLQEQRLERIEQAVESIAIEVERISEAQRFTARLAAERPRESNLQ